MTDGTGAPDPRPGRGGVGRGSLWIPGSLRLPREEAYLGEGLMLAGGPGAAPGVPPSQTRLACHS